VLRALQAKEGHHPEYDAGLGALVL
jgi:hypothetical protein